MDYNLVMEDSGIDSDSKNKTRMDDASDSSTGSTTNNHTRSTTRQLQKKLEARIEQAKRIQNSSKYTKIPSYEPDICITNCGSNNNSLIPIGQLAIPQKKNATLIEYLQSDESEDEMTIFPIKREEAKRKQDISDTFSIEELSECSEDSLNLGTLPETPKIRVPPTCFSCRCLII